MVNVANPQAGSCTCNSGGKCTCATARKSKRNTGPEPPLDPSTVVKPPTGHEYRRVLPKPHQNPSPVLPGRPGPVHNPSSTGSGKQSQRPHIHTDSLYSPYERAYDVNHSHHTPPSDHSESDVSSSVEVAPSPITRVPGNLESFGWSTYPVIPAHSLCTCGDSCSCSGCFEHRGPAAFQAYPGTSNSPPCANPRYCTSCVECAVVLGHPTQQTIEPGSFGTQNSSFMDEWLRQLVGGMPAPPVDGDTSHPDTPVPGSSHPPPGPSNCCGGNCGCQLGFCVCAGECFGECGDTWRGGSNAAGMSVGPTGSLPPIELNNGWDIPLGNQPWILAEHGISSDGSSEGEMVPGVSPAGEFWGV